MAFDEHLAERIRNWFVKQRIPVKELKMMGGIGFMLNEKMVVGVSKDLMMARIDPEDLESCRAPFSEENLTLPEKLQFGFLFLPPDFFDLEEQFDFWLQRCMDYHPRAPRKKKKKG
jgi:hypothetical protein